MGDMRIRYSLSYGRQNNFYTGIAGQKGYLAGTDGLFAQGNTAPDVTLGTLFYTNNSSATVISSLTLSHPSNGAGNVAGLFEGKEVKIIFLDSNTTVSGAPFKLVGTDNAFSQNSFLGLIYHNSAWYETDRTQVYQSVANFALANSSALNANSVSSFYLTYVSTGGVSGTAVVQSISGGMIGQRLLLVNNQSTGLIGVSTAGNISYSTSVGVIAGSGLYTLVASGGTVELLKVSNGQWSFVNR